MENEYAKIEKEVLKAVTFSNSDIRKFLVAKNFGNVKAFLQPFEPTDLKMLSDIAIQYEKYELCQVVKELLIENEQQEAYSQLEYLF
jgi:hypothetical protein